MMMGLENMYHDLVGSIDIEVLSLCVHFFHGGEHGKPFQYSCLENPMDKGVWWATVHGLLSWT